MNDTQLSKFTSTVTVKAGPMTRQEYNDLRGWKVPADENPDDEGYIVVNEEQASNTSKYKGYVNWLPEEVFNAAYGASETYIDRLKIESDELLAKINDLSKFTSMGRPFHMSDRDWDLLHIQHGHMSAYYDTLIERMK